MRDIYAKDIFYEGHERFLDLLQHIENERGSIDLTVKPHNLYIQGPIARERNLDPERIQEAVNVETLAVDHEEGGLQLVGGTKGKASARTSTKSRPRSRPPSGRPGPPSISAKEQLGIANQSREDIGFSAEQRPGDSSTLSKSRLGLQLARKQEESEQLEVISDLTGSGSAVHLLSQQPNQSALVEPTP